MKGVMIDATEISVTISLESQCYSEELSNGEERTIDRSLLFSFENNCVIPFLVILY